MASQSLTAIIPARKGSKGIPGKNHQLLAGRPLVAWSIAAALGAETVDRVIVATDDPIVSTIALTAGAKVHQRSAESATDTAPTERVLIEVVNAAGIDDYVLLQATSPLTTSSDIDRAVGVYAGHGYDSVVSVAPQRRFVWTRRDGQAEPWNYDPRRRPRRQDCEPVLVENGAIYVSSAEILRREGSRLGGRIGLFEMAPETFHELDEPEDWEVVRSLLLRRNREGDHWRHVRLVLADVDGVLTDNGMYWSGDGSELKKFSARDGKGFQLLHERGFKTALITSESNGLVARRGEKLGCHEAILGCADKLAAADRIRSELGLDWEEIAFIGDDLHDLELLDAVGISLAPSDAVDPVRIAVDYVLDKPGGEGCFRELADLLLASAEA